MRIVLDSNVWLSALLFPGGVCDRLLRRLRQEPYLLITSPALLAEMKGVLERKFDVPAVEAVKVLHAISGFAAVVEPTSRLKVIQDDADNRVLECALDGGAKLIVTGDKDLLRLARYGDVSVLSPAEMFEILEPLA